MRKVSKEVIASFLRYEKKRIKNTWTDGMSLYLHGNKIAWHETASKTYCTLAGWNTVTTRERLNSLYRLKGLAPPFRQKKHKAMFHDREIDPLEWFLVG